MCVRVSWVDKLEEVESPGGQRAEEVELELHISECPGVILEEILSKEINELQKYLDTERSANEKYSKSIMKMANLKDPRELIVLWAPFQPRVLCVFVLAPTYGTVYTGMDVELCNYVISRQIVIERRVT